MSRLFLAHNELILDQVSHIDVLNLLQLFLTLLQQNLATDFYDINLQLFCEIRSLSHLTNYFHANFHVLRSMHKLEH